MSVVCLLVTSGYIFSHHYVQLPPCWERCQCVTQYLHPYFPGHWELPSVDNYYIHVTFQQPTTYTSLWSNFIIILHFVMELKMRRRYENHQCQFVIELLIFHKQTFVEYSMQCGRKVTWRWQQTVCRRINSPVCWWLKIVNSLNILAATITKF